MRSYIVKIWDTQNEREQGISDIVEVGILDIRKAIDRARDIQEKNGYACVEVQDRREQISYYNNDGIEEKLNETEYINAIKQEKINKLYNIIYKDQDCIITGTKWLGKASSVIKALEENQVEIYNEYKDEVETLKKEYEDLKKDISMYDDEDIIKVFEHSMAITPMLDSNKQTLADLRTIFIDNLEKGKSMNYDIEDVVDSYMGYNEITNFMDYGTDRDSYAMPTLSKVYEEIMDLLKIKYESVYTDEISNGKFETIIDLGNDNRIAVDTSAWNDKEVLKNNIISIKEFEEKIELSAEDDMEM